MSTTPAVRTSCCAAPDLFSGTSSSDFERAMARVASAVGALRRSPDSGGPCSLRPNLPQLRRPPAVQRRVTRTRSPSRAHVFTVNRTPDRNRGPAGAPDQLDAQQNPPGSLTPVTWASSVGRRVGRVRPGPRPAAPLIGRGVCYVYRWWNLWEGVCGTPGRETRASA